MLLSSSRFLTVLFSTVLLLGAGLLTLSIVPAEGSAPSRLKLYKVHDPFHINGDAEFASMAASESWPGTGTEGDPYIIGGLMIEAPGENFAVWIENTRVHFVIRDCLIQNTTGASIYSGEGVYLYKAENATLEGSILKDNKENNLHAIYCKNINIINCTFSGALDQNGVYLHICTDVTIMNVSSSNNHGDGIRLDRTSRGLVENCSFIGNTYDGIEINENTHDLIVKGNILADNHHAGIIISTGSSGNDFEANTFLNCSFIINDEVECFTENHIPVSNTVNGLPIYQLFDDDGEGQSFQVNGGQLILGNFTDLTIENISINGGSAGVILGHCDHITVRDCNLSRNTYGIYLIGCDNTTVTGCALTGCSEYGAALGDSRDVLVKGNDMDGSEVGFGIYGSSRSSLEGNSMDGCNWSMWGMYFQDCLVSENSMDDAGFCGISLMDASDIIIRRNSISGAGPPSDPGDGIVLYYCSGIKVADNRLERNGIGIHGIELVRSYISNNTIDRSYGVGVNLTDCSNNTFEGNLLFMSADHGIEVVKDSIGSRDNLFWGNSFIYNNGSGTTFDPDHVQAYDDQGDERWSDDIADYGNHWSDWASPDSDSDGIVDVPYPLAGGAFDEAPLAQNQVLLITPPKNVSALAGRTSVNISWEPPEFSRSGDVTKYRIYREEVGGGNPFLQELPGSIHHYIDSEVESGRTYIYRLSARNIYGEGPKGREVQAVPDSDAPIVEIFHPAEGAMMNLSEATVNWTGSDNVGVSYFEHRLDGSNWTYGGSSGHANLTALEEGVHEFEVRAHDAMDNTGNDTVRFTIDLTAPSLVLSSPADGTITNQNDINVEWEGLDELSGIAGFSTSLDGSDPERTNSGSAWLTELSEGEHHFQVTAFDNAGNGAHASISFTVDTLLPAVTIISPAQGALLTGSEVTLEWSGDGTGTAIIGYFTKVDAQNWTDRGDDDSSTVLTGLGNGNHTVWVRAIDEAGNSNETAVTFQIISGGVVKKVKITGRVVDEEGKPVDGAKVASDTGEDTYTDSEGYFTLEVPEGQRRITISKKGWRTYNKNVVAEGDDTIDMGMLEMREKEKGDPWYRTPLAVCLVCCLVPIVILLLFLFIGVLARARKHRAARMEE